MADEITPDLGEVVRELGAVREALRPFALVVAFIPKGTDDDVLVLLTVVSHASPDESAAYQPPVPLTVGDIRRAAAVLGLEQHEGRIDSTRP